MFWGEEPLVSAKVWSSQEDWVLRRGSGRSTGHSHALWDSVGSMRTVSLRPRETGTSGFDHRKDGVRLALQGHHL